MLKRIKYVSRFSRPLSEVELEELSELCVRKNMQAGITGVLMTSGHLFFQVLEGPVAAVDTTYATIVNDARHKDIVLLGEEMPVRSRLFPDWAMKTLSLDASRADRLEPLHALLETIVEQRRSIGRLTEVLARAVWAELVFGSARADDANKEQN